MLMHVQIRLVVGKRNVVKEEKCRWSNFGVICKYSKYYKFTLPTNKIIGGLRGNVQPL